MTIHFSSYTPITEQLTNIKQKIKNLNMCFYGNNTIPRLCIWVKDLKYYEMEKRDQGINIYELFFRRYRGFAEERGDYNPKQNVKINAI